MNLFEELTTALNNNSRVDLAAIGRRVLAQNIECFVAQYFIQHPEADPKHLTLVYQPSLTDLTYMFKVSIQEKP